MQCREFPLPKGGAIRLFLGDCLEGMASLAASSIDVIVTSPPYNLGIRYGKYDDTLPRERYLEWTGKWAEASRRALGEDGSLFLNVGSKPKDPWVALDVANVFRKRYFLQNTFHWVKSISIDAECMGKEHAGAVSVGHYKPISSARFVNDCHEFLFHFTPSGEVPLDRLAVGVPYQDKSNVARWNGKADRRCRGNTWFVPYETIQSHDRERPHPATFPSRLPEMCLRVHGLARLRQAMDPFLGLGSSAIACARLGIPFVGFELDPDYFALACERVESAIQQP